MTGGSHVGGGAGSPHDKDSCNEIDFTTSMASPTPQIVSLLKEGDILQVALREEKNRTFVAVLYKGDIAGSIIERVGKLASCIREGYVFEAEVRSVRGGKVEINIRAL